MGIIQFLLAFLAGGATVIVFEVRELEALLEPFRGFFEWLLRAP